MNKVKMLVVIVGLVILTPFLADFALSTKSYLDGADLKVSNTEIPSKYVFIFGPERTVVIDDKFNQFIRAWGGSPDEVEVNNNIRTLTFREPAILKTSVDCIEPNDDYVKVKGYMGIISQDIEFTVNSEGVISSNKWHGG